MAKGRTGTRAKVGPPRKSPPKPAMTPERLLVEFDAIVTADRGLGRVFSIDVDKYGVMRAKARIAGQIWIRSKSINDPWGWDSVLKDWRYYQECWIANRRAS